MGTNSAGNVGAPNEGKTDMGRGNVTTFPVTKADRKTGKVAGPGGKPNPNTVDGNKRSTTDSRFG